MRTRRGSPLFWTALISSFLAAAGLPLAASEEPTTVIIALDAVPYSVVAELTERRGGQDAIFEDLRGPVPLISTFPSTTSLAIAAILEPFGLEISPGYEAKHFDRELNRVRGGGLVSYNRFKFPWRTFFDWKRKSLWAKMTSALRPVKASYASIDSSLDAFLAEAGSGPYFIYYDTTDLAGHLRSPASLGPILRRLDAKLSELHREHPERPFHTVLFSDRGMAGGEPLSNVRKGVFRALEEDGFKIASHLEGPDDVIFAPFGLVSSFVAFTREGREVEAARAIARVEGVDLCAAPEDGGWRLESRRGSARIERRPARSGGGEEWSYRSLDGGDPLGWAELVERLEAQSPETAPWFPDQRWFEATRADEYPDALYRIASAFELVENPASVVCSVAPGYLFGAALTNFSSRVSVGQLEWTHGALRRDESFGFLMSDVPGWRTRGPERFSEALRAFATER